MSRRTVEDAPQLYARTAGVLYVLVIVLGFFAQGVRDRLVSGDAAATATAITSSEALWRLAIVADAVALGCVLGLAMAYYVLLRPVSREINLLSTFIRLVAASIQAVSLLGLLAAVTTLRSAASAHLFTSDQLDALVVLAIRIHSQGFGLALLFVGFGFLFHGWLIYRSGFLPAVLGVLIEIAGLCYLTNSLALFLAPALESRIFPLILLPAFVGELCLCLWLLVKGVDVAAWRSRAAGVQHAAEG